MATARRQLGYVSSLTTQTSFITGVYGVATGGTSNARTVGGVDYTVLTFSSDDNLVVTQAGVFDILVIAGGGGGGGVNQSASNTNTGGGGGAGAVIGFAETTTVYLEADTYVVDIGAGGAGGQISGNQGLASSIESVISAAGGGRGAGSFSAGTYQNASVGGSGGGSNNNLSSQYSTSVPSVTPLFGKSGGVCSVVTASGGGGGYSTAGSNGVSTTGGAGGNGVDIASWGTVASGTDFVAAGGGGGGATPGAGGTGGGGAGASSGTGGAGTTAGSGGGGSRAGDGTGGAGAAGKVFVRFKV